MFAGISSVPGWFYIVAIAVVCLIHYYFRMEDTIRGDISMTKKKIGKRQRPKISMYHEEMSD